MWCVFARASGPWLGYELRLLVMGFGLKFSPPLPLLCWYLCLGFTIVVSSPAFAFFLRGLLRVVGCVECGDFAEKEAHLTFGCFPGGGCAVPEVFLFRVFSAVVQSKRYNGVIDISGAGSCLWRNLAT